MHTIKIITHDELIAELSGVEQFETIDLGSVQIHMVSGDSPVLFLVENPGDYEGSALVTVSKSA